jgi:hypothetical protein
MEVQPATDPCLLAAICVEDVVVRAEKIVTGSALINLQARN